MDSKTSVHSLYDTTYFLEILFNCLFNFKSSSFVKYTFLIPSILVKRRTVKPEIRFIVSLFIPDAAFFFFLGFLSLFFIGITSYLITKLLSIKNKLLIGFVCGILITNLTVTLLNATYILDVDIYMFSLLLAVLSVYIFRRYKYGFLFSPLLLVGSLGLYQSFFQVAIFLFMYYIFGMKSIKVKMDKNFNSKNIF